MTYDLTKFDLGDMLKCSLRLRETASGAATLEAAANRTCRFLYDELHGPDTRMRARSCAVTRPTHSARSSPIFRISRVIFSVWRRRDRA